MDLTSDTIVHVFDLSSECVVVPKKSERQAAGYLKPCRTNNYISSEHHWYSIKNLRLGRIHAAMLSSLGTDQKNLRISILSPKDETQSNLHSVLDCSAFDCDDGGLIVMMVNACERRPSVSS